MLYSALHGTLLVTLLSLGAFFGASCAESLGFPWEQIGSVAGVAVGILVFKLAIPVGDESDDESS